MVFRKCVCIQSPGVCMYVCICVGICMESVYRRVFKFGSVLVVSSLFETNSPKTAKITSVNPSKQHGDRSLPAPLSRATRGLCCSLSHSIYSTEGLCGLDGPPEAARGLLGEDIEQEIERVFLCAFGSVRVCTRECFGSCLMLETQDKRNLGAFCDTRFSV